MARALTKPAGPRGDGRGTLTVTADRGSVDSEAIAACDQAGMTPLVLQPMTADARAEGRCGKPDFIYLPEQDVDHRLAGPTMPW